MNINQKYTLLIVLYFSFLGMTQGQKVTISNDVNIRTDYAYDLLGPMGDKILLYRDKGFEHSIEFYNQNLEFISDKILRFEQKKVRIIGLLPQDSTIMIFYAFDKKKFTYVNAQELDSRGNAIDTIAIFKEKKGFTRKRYKFTSSEDRKKALIFSLEKDRINLAVFDNSAKKLLWDDMIEYSDYKIRESFKKTRITNNGDVFLLMETNNSRFSKDKHQLELNYFPINSDVVESYFFRLKGFISIDINLKVDNKNNRVIIAGLSSEDNSEKATGYFTYNAPINSIDKSTKIKPVNFDDELIKEVYGKSSKKKQSLKHFGLQNILIRQDGGMILQAEMNREYSRRSGYGNQRRFGTNYYGNDSWIDYENDDMVFIAVHPSGEEHWTKVLYKKQFSQDDGGVFSSFFTFITPSRMRIIYNDQIKKNGTVSEYVLDPLGNLERNALLSTEDQQLLLRFQEAKQISSNELLVPSEKSGFLNLVKISF